MNLIVRVIVSAIAILFCAWLLPGVHVNGFLGALITGIVLIILNSTIRPILKFFSLPITFLTLGLFLIIINGFIIVIADWLLTDLFVDNFLWAILFSLVLAVVTTVLENIVEPKRQ